jgi:hypothetical protein
VGSAIILLHGIGQQSHTAGSFRHEVRADAVKGMREAGHTALAERELDGDLELRTVFYGDLFADGQRQGGTPLVPLASSPEQQEIEEQFAFSVLLALAEQADDPSDREIALAAVMKDEEALERAQAQRGSVRRAAADTIGMLLRTRWAGRHLALAMVDSIPRGSWLPLRQVSDYLLYRRAPIQDRFRAAMDAGEVRAVIAHSLGSVVAWEALASGSWEVPLLLTLGSPLGMPHAIYDRLQPAPPRYPDRVHSWVNLSAANDIVATPRALRELFPGDGRPLLDDTVVIRHLLPLEPHSFRRYLATQKVWHFVRAAIDA